MIIQTATIRLISMPMTHSFRTSTGVMNRKMAVVVELQTPDGRRGFGEAAAPQWPTYIEETADTCYRSLSDVLVPTILGRDLRSPQAFVACYQHLRGNRFAKAGLESAFWDLLSQEWNAPLCDIVGGVRKSIAVGESLGIKDTITDLLHDIERCFQEGYQRIKLKIEPGWDLEVVAAARQAFPNAVLMVDANSAFHGRRADR